MTQAIEYDPFATVELAQVIDSTAAQKEIWAAARLDGEASCAFNESISLYLHGPLDVPALAKAFEQLTAHHEALRCTFSPYDGRLCIAAQLDIDLPLQDLTGQSPSDQERALQAARAAEVETPFDLELGPLLRVRLLRLGPQKHWLVLTAHHIVCDGWAMAVMLRDLGLFYSAAKADAPPKAPAAQPFSEYAVWAAAQIETVAQSGALNYWLKQFQGDVPVLQLPTDRPHPPVKTFRAGRVDREISPDLVKQLKAAGAKSGASFFTVLFASFAAFLHRLTGQRDLVIGVPAAGQNASGMENVVGHCVNLLPIRCVLDPASTFGQWLKQTRTLVLDAYDHQQITFGQLLPHLKLARDPSLTPLVSTVFNLDQAVQGKDLHFAGLEVAYQSNPRHFENSEFSINASESSGRVVLECQYNKDLFDDETIADRLESFEALLAGIISGPEELLARLPMLSRAQQEKMLVQWNATNQDYPREYTLARLVQEQAEQTPQRPALTFGAETLSYAELNGRANQLAHHLAARGAGRGKLVGLCLERSLEMVVGLLAVLKTGAGYLPLDPAYPRERLRFMVDDAKIALVLTQDSSADLFPSDHVRILCYDREAGEVAQQPTTPPSCTAQPNDIAYVIYTSGSTGTPKGVAVPHAGVVNLFTSMRMWPGIGDNDTMLALASLSFDMSVPEILLPLTVGARVVLPGQEIVGDGQSLLRLLAESRATILQGTPATWRMLLQAGWQGDPRLSLWCGGEALSAELVRALLARGKNLWNLYGPTETTACCIGFPVTDPDCIRIGKPMANTQAYVLDGNLQPVPVGVPGELYIGGAGVTTGYLGRPELTSQRFVANPYHDPFADYLNPRLYRSGDLARWHRDGTLEYLGRNDHQIKLRGYRIELGEIETALTACPGVRQTLVMVRTDRTNDPRLVAYVVPAAEEQVTATELRKHLRQRLPQHMIPQHFVELEALPLTSNGKVDRARLPAPFAAPAGMEPQRTGILNPVQKYVLGVCRDILQSPDVGLEHNFFQVGGHSLLALQLLGRLEKDTGVRLSPRVLIVQSLGQLAEHLPAERIPVSS